MTARSHEQPALLAVLGERVLNHTQGALVSLRIEHASKYIGSKGASNRQLRGNRSISEWLEHVLKHSLGLTNFNKKLLNQCFSVFPILLSLLESVRDTLIGLTSFCFIL